MSERIRYPPKDTTEESTTVDSAQRMICFHALQLVSGEPYEKHEKQQYVWLDPGGVKIISFPVLEGVTLEVCLASFWSTAGEVDVSVDFNFRGVRPSPSRISIAGGQRVSEVVRVHNCLVTTDISPNAKLDKWHQVIKPSAPGKISALGERDVLLDGSRLYQLVLSYEVDQSDAGEVIFSCFL